MVTHKFFRVKRGAHNFAEVSVSLRQEEGAIEISWSAEATPLQGRYRSAIEAAVRAGAAAAAALGTRPSRIHVEQIVEVPADTTSDAVGCAAALAAWKAWGLPLDRTSVSLDSEGQWRVDYRVS
jgi:hypothetical protein